MTASITKVDQVSNRTDWVVTDNTTITDAAIVFKALSEKQNIWAIERLGNWIKFIEGLILHDVMLADDRIFRSQPLIQELRGHIGDCIAGVDLGDEYRTNLKIKVRSKCQEVKEALINEQPFESGLTYNEKKRILNKAYSQLHRGLFYTGMATELGLPYRPSDNREKIFGTVFKNNELLREDARIDQEAVLTAHLLKQLEQSANEYSTNVYGLSGLKIASAELPPIALMLIDLAIKTGSWSEAIFELRNSKSATKFRSWVKDVVFSLRSGDSKGINELNKVNSFIKGWSVAPDEGVRYKTRQVGIGQLSKYLLLPMNYQVNDRILAPPPHLVFLNGIFKTSVSLKSFGDLSKVRL